MTKSTKSLTHGSVWSAIARLAVPMTLGIVAVLSVSLVDTYFVGKLGTDELAALSFTFPVTLAIASLASGLGAGAASVVSRAIGSGKSKNAQRLSTDSLILATCIVIIVSLAGLLTIEPLFSVLGASGNVLTLIDRYMTIWYFSMPFLVIPIVANSIIRAVGDAFWPSVIMIAAALINVAFTPLLIFGWGPFPRMEIEGAALGTMIARIVTLVFALYIAGRREQLIAWGVPTMGEFVESAKQVLRVGLPAGTGSVINPIGIAIVTAILASYGSQTVAAFGVATRIESFACIPMLALSAAVGPIVGQNWGANNKVRVIKAVINCYIVCVGWALLLALALSFLALPVSTLLASNSEVAEISASYLSIVTFSLWGYGIVIVSSAAFNSLGRSITGLSYYMLRSAVLYVPLSMLAGWFFTSEAVYYAIALANGMAGIAVAYYTLWWLKKAQLCDCEPNTFATDINS